MVRQVSTRLGGARLTLVVKRIKGKLYVYDEFRDPVTRKVQTIYIGPLEEMARVYQLYKSLGKVEKLTKRDLRRLARILLEEYVRRVEQVVKSKKPEGEPIGKVVRRPGFEPGTSGVAGRRPSPG